MVNYKYPAKYRFGKEGLTVLFSANRTGTVVDLGDDPFKTMGEHRTDWTGPEGNPKWVLIPELSNRQKLHEAVSKLKENY